MFFLANESNFLRDIHGIGCIERSGCLAAFRGAEAASGIALSDEPSLQWRKKTEETSGRASPRGVVRKEGMSEGNNVRSGYSLHWSDREKFRERESVELSQSKDNKKVSIQASRGKHEVRSYVEETYGFQKFQ